MRALTVLIPTPPLRKKHAKIRRLSRRVKDHGTPAPSTFRSHRWLEKEEKNGSLALPGSRCSNIRWISLASVRRPSLGAAAPTASQPGWPHGGTRLTIRRALGRVRAGVRRVTPVDLPRRPRRSRRREQVMHASLIATNAVSHWLACGEMASPFSQQGQRRVVGVETQAP
jgi:hypothetical protein